ncbi:unnamed protein product [Caenorhabditis auriculariae]|uniref:Uncharacterized protein n=1 Tax=Caenorhabditis auriculariae TaxID=2777116 RepID=A0A8S1HZ35_9PELO|nr:unnamed protein product [Caenorhabditis auriculariae]
MRADCCAHARADTRECMRLKKEETEKKKREKEEKKKQEEDEAAKAAAETAEQEMENESDESDEDIDVETVETKKDDKLTLGYIFARMGPRKTKKSKEEIEEDLRVINEKAKQENLTKLVVKTEHIPDKKARSLMAFIFSELQTQRDDIQKLRKELREAKEPERKKKKRAVQTRKTSSTISLIASTASISVAHQEVFKTASWTDDYSIVEQIEMLVKHFLQQYFLPGSEIVAYHCFDYDASNYILTQILNAITLKEEFSGLVGNQRNWDDWTEVINAAIKKILIAGRRVIPLWKPFSAEEFEEINRPVDPKKDGSPEEEPQDDCKCNPSTLKEPSPPMGWYTIPVTPDNYDFALNEPCWVYDGYDWYLGELGERDAEKRPIVKIHNLEKLCFIFKDETVETLRKYSSDAECSYAVCRNFANHIHRLVAD